MPEDHENKTQKLAKLFLFENSVTLAKVLLAEWVISSRNLWQKAVYTNLSHWRKNSKKLCGVLIKLCMKLYQKHFEVKDQHSDFKWQHRESLIEFNDKKLRVKL